MIHDNDLRSRVKEINEKIQELKELLEDQPIIVCEDGRKNDILQMKSGSVTRNNLNKPTIAITFNGIEIMQLGSQYKSSSDEYEYGAYELSPTKYKYKKYIDPNAKIKRCDYCEKTPTRATQKYDRLGVAFYCEEHWKERPLHLCDKCETHSSHTFKSIADVEIKLCGDHFEKYTNW